MALRKKQAWITYAVDDDTVTSAVVLAKSLKRAGTTRRIVVVTNGKVSVEKRSTLRKVFHAVFHADELKLLVPSSAKSIDHLKDEEQAKLFAFSLDLFDKCVFISPFSLMLENSDSIFDLGIGTGFAGTKSGNDLFVFRPNARLCEYLVANAAPKNGNIFHEMLVKAWLGNQLNSQNGPVEVIPEKVVGYLNMKTGYLEKENIHPKIVQFGNGEEGFLQRVEDLTKDEDLGLLEKMIFSTWLKIFEANATNVIEEQHYENEPIAIIGMSCRYPGSNNLSEFWDLLFSGEDGIQAVPPFRWTRDHSIRVTQQDRQTEAGFLKHSIDEFDARFFGVSPKEAAFMDPQSRILHEVLWESLEDAGIDPLSLYGTHTGIYTGSWMNDYRDIVQRSPDFEFFRSYMGNSIGAVAARLSFLLGLTGPSIATESGCSSAIVALDLAVKNLRNGETNLSLVGGINLLLRPFTSNLMEYVISPNGRCKTFDERADGFGRAEGCGVLVLKRLSDALRDRDNIWAVIRGSAVSQEGLSRSLGTPTVYCEALAIQLALADANIRPEQVGFVETHGTGTPVGDPMEVAAIAKAYGSESRHRPLVIGSVKTNVGHTESCSGITGVMKAVLTMQHEVIPRHRNFEILNQKIDLNSIPAIIPMENVPWPRIPGQPRFCGISSFGITGTDGHVILEETPEYALPKINLKLKRPLHLLRISGKSKEALEDLIERYKAHFSDRTDEDDFANAAYTANIGRANFNHQIFITAENHQQAVKAIEEKKFSATGELKQENGEICFLFTGQGSQYPGMAKTLYETSPVFRIHFDHCDLKLRKLYNLSLRPILWADDTSKNNNLAQTIYSQTSIFCVEYCLLKLWQSWGIEPNYVLGHSLGEFCAAVAAKILTFEEALVLVAERSQLIDRLPRGSMLVIKEDLKKVTKLMRASHNNDLDVAAVNSPDQTVVAGDTAKITKFQEYLKAEGVKSVVLEATHAFHSRHMDPMLQEYGKVAERITPHDAIGSKKIGFISGMEGKLIKDFTKINGEYWVRHTREKVNFLNACKALRELGVTEFLEVGPQPVLSSFVMMNNDDIPMSCLPSLRKGVGEWETLLGSLAKLALNGFHIDWKAFDEPYPRKKVQLPFHPFFRKSFWVEPSATNRPLIHPLVGYSLPNASSLSIFQNDLALKSVPYLKDHCIGTRTVFPGAGFTEICLAAGYCVASAQTETLDAPERPLRIQNLKIDAPLELKDEKRCRLQVIVDLPENGDADNKLQESQAQGFRVKVFHQQQDHSEESGSGKWVQHASSHFVAVPTTKEAAQKWNPTRIKEIMEGNEYTSSDGFYKRIDDAGLKFGETFKTLQKAWFAPQKDGKNLDEVVAEIQAPADFNKYLLHPLIIDAMFQASILTKFRHENSAKLSVPVHIGQLTLFSTLGDNCGPLYLHAWSENEKYDVFVGTICDDSEVGSLIPIALMENVELIQTNVKTIESILEQQTSSLPEAWDEVWKVIPGPSSNRIELTTISKKEFLQLMGEDIPLSQQEIQDDEQCERLIYLYILKALYDLGWRPQVGQVVTANELCSSLGLLPRFSQLVHFYFSVMENEDKTMEYDAVNDRWKVNKLPLPRDAMEKEITDKYSSLNLSSLTKIVNIYANISKSLRGILMGEISPLSIIYPTETDQQNYSADCFYQNHPNYSHAVPNIKNSVSAFLSRLKPMNNITPGNRILRVLEVGGGTSTFSIPILTSLREVWGTDLEYYFTDISQSFFLKAEKRLQDFKDNVKYAVFNIEQSPLEQGIPLNYFDMVIAVDVLHATRDIRESLVHMRQTMRPNGMLFLEETLVEDRGITFLFGLLEGYWRMNDLQWRRHHCCLSEEKWRQLFSLSGFKSVAALRSYFDRFGCLAAEAIGDLEEIPTLSLAQNVELEGVKRWLIFSPSKDHPLVNKLASILRLFGYNVTVLLKGNHDFLQGLNKNVIGIVYAWGLDYQEKNCEAIALPFLAITQKILSINKPPKVYILTNGVQPVVPDVPTSNPTPSVLYGMIKSLKNEYIDLFIRYVDLDLESPTSVMVEQVLYELTMSKDTKEQLRVQVAYRNGLRHEARLVKAVGVQTEKDELKLPPSTDRYHLVLPKSRVIQDLEFESLEEERVQEDEIEIKITAYGLNFRDIFAVLKPIPQFESINTIGLDFSGIVTKTGSAQGKWKVGDRVFGANSWKEDQLPSHLVLDSQCVFRIPDKMTYWEASTIPTVFFTVYHCFITVAKLKKEDTVLIHTGSGGVGLAAIQVARMIGAQIITTAGNKKKRAYLRSLGIEHVFHSRDTSYEKQILRVTNGRGLDVVLNSITGPGFKEATLNSCAKNARFVEMSKLNVWTCQEVKMLRPDVSYTIVDLTELGKNDWTNLHLILGQALKEEALTPLPYVKFDALNIRQAMQHLQKAKHIGKVVCTMPEVKTENGKFKVSVPLFNAESTYLITGGLGGIGFEVCKWMLGKGATDVVLTGRSQPKEKVLNEVQRLNESGYNVTVKLGDVGDFDQCKALIDHINCTGKPLRGIHHCAGVLRDNLYGSQTWESFRATFTPKVSGTWNLHELTKDVHLEQFVLYSSATALMGTLAQANHAAANCFEDAFAHYRHSKGLPAVTINWGQWAQVGCAKEVLVSGISPVSVQRMLNGLEVALKNCRTQLSFCDYDSFHKFVIICPLIKHYIDDRLFKKNQDDNPNYKGVSSEQVWKELDNAPENQDKVNILSTYLKNIVRSALRLESDEIISENANIQDLGVDSLMMIELKNSIQTLLGSRITIATSMLKDCSTILEISNRIIGKILEEDDNNLEGGDRSRMQYSPEEFTKLLMKDCKLDESICPSPEQERVTRSSEIRSIFLTGVTGQLGPYILAKIFESYKSVKKVTCLIRTKGKASAKERLVKVLTSMNLQSVVDLDKVACIQGNLSMRRFGLTKDEYNDLCYSTDAVIHCAVKSNHVEMYREMEDETGNDARTVNVGGTHNILRFAATGKVKLVYHASTMLAVFGGIEQNTFSDRWPEMEEIKVIVDHNIPGYYTSKFVSELLVKQANERGVPCKVFRLPGITGSSETGRINWSSNHLILRLLTYLKIKAMPSMPIAAHYLPVDTCAEMTLKLFFNDQVPCEVFNVCYPHPQVEQEFVNLALEQFGVEVDLVEFSEFVELLQQTETPLEAMKELYLNFEWIISILGSDAFPSNRGYLLSPQTFFENEKISKYLPELANYQLSSMDVIKKDLQYLRAEGVLEKFGVHI